MRITRLAALALLPLISIAQADVKTFSWQRPTSYDNGTPLPTAELAGYDLTCNGAVVATNVPGGTNESHARDFAPGEYSCSMRAFDIFGGVSVPSNSVSFVVPRPSPNAPAALSVD
jgi:hypothetical protein